MFSNIFNLFFIESFSVQIIVTNKEYDIKLIQISCNDKK